jgi:8-oxo-dGTP diphosphatase
MLLLRHASAGERLSSPSRDRARRLDRLGRAQAARLVDTLPGEEVGRIVSSPHRRCVETVGPLARALGIVVEVRPEVAPEAERRQVLALLRELPETALVCTHREVLERLFGSRAGCEKGGAWIVERRGRRWVPSAYLAPPEVAVRPRRATAAV